MYYSKIKKNYSVYYQVKNQAFPVSGWALPRRPLRPISSTGERDVYLGGSLGNRETWREDIAIPMLLKHGLSFFNPAASACSGRLLPMEAALMENSRVLLFVITNTTLGVSAMALVSCSFITYHTLIWLFFSFLFFLLY